MVRNSLWAACAVQPGPRVARFVPLLSATAIYSGASRWACRDLAIYSLRALAEHAPQTGDW
eukprot:scaffold23600_cov120-Isochrysis_galbana.AAC.2